MRSQRTCRWCILAAMKTRVPLVIAAVLGVPLHVLAQTVELVLVNRQVNHVQVSAGTAAPDGATPYEFWIGIHGQNLTAPAFTFGFKKPGDSVTLYPGIVVATGTEWRAPDPPSSARFAGLGLLDAVFPGGTYEIQTSVGNTTLDLPNLAGNTNDGFASTPYVSATQDGNPVTWTGGIMMIDPTKELTLANGPWTVNNGIGGKRIGLRVGGNALNLETTNENPIGSYLFSGLTVQLQIPAHTLVAGNFYAGSLEYSRVLGSGPNVDLSATYGAGAIGAPIYTAYTAFAIQAIPEPSTYAAIIGGLALAGVVIHRRRKLQQG